MLALKAADAPPNAPKEDVVAARALLACAFAARFDMAGLGEGNATQGRGRRWQVGGMSLWRRKKSEPAAATYPSTHKKHTLARQSPWQRFTDYAKYAALLDDGTNCG